LRHYSQKSRPPITLQFAQNILQDPYDCNHSRINYCNYFSLSGNTVIIYVKQWQTLFAAISSSDLSSKIFELHQIQFSRHFRHFQDFQESPRQGLPIQRL